MKILFLLFAFTSFMPAFAQNMDILDKYHWKNRILILFSDEDSSEAQRQLALWQEHKTGLAERDLVIFQVKGKDVTGPGDIFYEKKWADKLRQRYDVENVPFAVVLIGKDGGEKLTEKKLLPVEKLFATIDAMPMRQQEMKN